MHQLMYKFRSTTRNSGEPSNLKYLTKTEFGVDQLELSDFFSGFSEDDSGKASGGGKKKKGVRIDFSYMDYDGSRAYAPADGDFTLGLYLKYKPDLIKNHKELEYLYSVEIKSLYLLSCFSKIHSALFCSLFSSLGLGVSPKIHSGFVFCIFFEVSITFLL